MSLEIKKKKIYDRFCATCQLSNIFLSFPSSSPLLDLFILPFYFSLALYPPFPRLVQGQPMSELFHYVTFYLQQVFASEESCLCRALVRFRGRIRLSFSFFVLLFFLAWCAVFISKQQDKGIFPYANVVVHGNVISLKQLL